MSVTLNGTNGLTFNDGSAQNTAATGFGFKNRIINGAMVIAQRGTGAFTSSGDFGVDRFKQSWSGVGVLTSQQSSDAPAGFVNSLKVTVSTIDASVTGGDFYQIEHMIEGYNSADFNWGSSTAQGVTVSFWAKASQTGTYSVALANSDGSRSYPSSITINAANTWEYKTIVVPATTAGTWLTTNGIGVGLRIGFAYGSTYNGATANAWMTTTGFANAFVTPTNNMMGTLNATFYITGVQFEIGSTATSFDYRPFGLELDLCLRYFEKSFSYETAPAHNVGGLPVVPIGSNLGCGGNAYWTIPFKTCKRTSSYTVRWYDPIGAHTVTENWMRAIIACDSGTAYGPNSNMAMNSPTTNHMAGYCQVGTSVPPIFYWTVDAEL